MGKAQRRKLERTPAPAPPPAVSPRRAVPAGGGVIAALVPPLLIAAVTLVTYANSFAIPFIFDDFFEITGNPAVKSVEPFVALCDALARAAGAHLRVELSLGARSTCGAITSSTCWCISPTACWCTRWCSGR
jgi:hypothetical protein